MSCENYLTLKGVEHISKELESQNILYGIIDFFTFIPNCNDIIQTRV